MSNNNEELIRSITDAQNAIERAINMLRSQSYKNMDFNTANRRMDFNTENADRDNAYYASRKHLNSFTCPKCGEDASVNHFCNK